MLCRIQQLCSDWQGDTHRTSAPWPIFACLLSTSPLWQDGELFTWGQGMFGRLGHGTHENLRSPLKVQALDGVVITEVTAVATDRLPLLNARVVHVR